MFLAAALVLRALVALAALAAFDLLALLTLLGGLLAAFLLVLPVCLILLPRLVGILVRHAEIPHGWVNPAPGDNTGFDWGGDGFISAVPRNAMRIASS
jgi:hypothetical protein